MTEVSYIKKKVGENEDDYEVVDAAAREDIKTLNDTAVISTVVRKIVKVSVLPDEPEDDVFYIIAD
ncbi:MAG: hypothetical protein LUH07_12925 [Lachnospiraceae bacterium]|nr:hypothetical protein [Lachnospiraceae bacterium]